MLSEEHRCLVEQMAFELLSVGETLVGCAQGDSFHGFFRQSSAGVHGCGVRFVGLFRWELSGGGGWRLDFSGREDGV